MLLIKFAILGTIRWTYQHAATETWTGAVDIRPAEGMAAEARLDCCEWAVHGL